MHTYHKCHQLDQKFFTLKFECKFVTFNECSLMCMLLTSHGARMKRKSILQLLGFSAVLAWKIFFHPPPTSHLKQNFQTSIERWFPVRTAQSRNLNVYKHHKRLTGWNANRCYSLRITYLIFETFQTLFPTASLIFTAMKVLIKWYMYIRENET